MYGIYSKIFQLFLRPEYMALAISILAITASVYIAYKNRRYALAQAEYFELKKIAEKIISKLLILDNHRERLRSYMQLSYDATRNPNAVFFDGNDTFNRAEFEKDGGDIVAYIDIYFPNLGEEWNDCLEKMGSMFTIAFVVNALRERNEPIDWKAQAERFNEANQALGIKPKEISNKIKDELRRFKVKNL